MSSGYTRATLFALLVVVWLIVLTACWFRLSRTAAQAHSLMQSVVAVRGRLSADAGRTETRSPARADRLVSVVGAFWSLGTAPPPYDPTILAPPPPRRP